MICHKENKKKLLRLAIAKGSRDLTENSTFPSLSLLIQIVMQPEKLVIEAKETEREKSVWRW
jgi:hypothetical protein